MNRAIASVVRDRILSKTDFIEIAAGLVQTVERVNVQGPEMKAVSFKHPISADVTSTNPDCIQPNGYADLSPDSTRKSILYFEDQGVQILRRESSFIHYRSKLRAIAWFNLSYFENPLQVTAAMTNAIISSLTMNPINAGNISRLFLTGSSVPIIGMNLFSSYSFKDPIHQYLMAPYDIVAVDLQIDFAINVSCLPVVLKEPTC